MDIYSFLFDSMHPDVKNGWYGNLCLSRILLPLLQSKHRLRESCIYEGDAILTEFSQTVSEFSTEDKKHFHQMHISVEGLVQVLWETIDCLKDGAFFTGNVNSLAKVLPYNTCYAVTITSLDKQHVELINNQLKEFKPYLGCAALDMGNPLLTKIFLRHLIHTAFVKDGLIGIREQTLKGDCYLETPSLSSEYTITLLSDEDFHHNAPPVPLASALSDRGKSTVEKLSPKNWQSHHQKLTDELYQFSLKENKNVKFSSKLPEGFDSIEIPRQKLTDYALNPLHPSGKEKAHLFQKKLGLTSNDAEYLALQIKTNLPNADIETLNITAHGIQYSARLVIEGKNGNKMTILTAWIVRQSQVAQLTTLRVATEDEQLSSNLGESLGLYVPIEMPEKQRWKKIFDIAHSFAERAFLGKTPKPIVVEGTVYREGICGHAYIKLPDARKRFCKWVIKENLGQRILKGVILDAHFRPPSQSYEQNCAYADAFSYVLSLNSIEHTVHKWID